jgi:hypothetical protein
MYESWIQDLREKNEFTRNYAILTGSFSNMELAKKMIESEKPSFSSSDADFEATTRMIEQDVERELAQKQTRRRRRRRRQGVVNG